MKRKEFQISVEHPVGNGIIAHGYIVNVKTAEQAKTAWQKAYPDDEIVGVKEYTDKVQNQDDEQVRMKKKEFVEGVLIKNDDNGKPCRVGDKVKVSVEEGILHDPYHNGDGRYFPAGEYTGILVLLKSKGIAVRLDNGNYIFPRLTNTSFRKWKWELIKTKEGIK
jgi:hypothetical protein